VVPRQHLRGIVLALGLLVAGACGGAQKRAALPPLTEEQAHAFDNGIDFIASLEGLEGRWKDDWEHDLTLRVSASDRVALVTVGTLRTDSDPQQRVTYRLHAEVDKDLVGGGDDEIELTVLADQVGFASVHDNQTRLTDKQYVVYLREGPEGSRWHLSAASDAVVLETERKITDLARAPKKSDGARVIVHTN
jgi:hypothetical protein